MFQGLYFKDSQNETVLRIVTVWHSVALEKIGSTNVVFAKI